MKRLLACLAMLMLGGCSNGARVSPTTPSTPPLAPTSETFTGTVPVGGTDSHPFIVSLSNGQITVDLTAAGPPSTIPMGVGLGTITSGTCTVPSTAYVVTPPGPGSQFGLNNLSAGTYCIAIFDAGNQVVDVTYSVTVTHY